MKRFYIVSTVLAVALVALSLDLLPVRCVDCGRMMFRTDVCSALCGGRGDYIDACLSNPAPAGQTSVGIAAGTPATDIQTEGTAERPS